MAQVRNTANSTARALEQTGKDPRLERKKERAKAEQAGHREEVPQTQNKEAQQTQNKKTPEAVQTQKGQNINKNI